MKKPNVLKKEQEPTRETAERKAMLVLFKYPDKEFSLSDLAKEAGVAKGNIGAYIKILEDAGLIRIERLSKIWRIRAARENEHFKRMKTAVNLTKILNSNIVEAVNSRFHNPKAIVLFGSYRKGEDVTSSDIDIAVECDESKEYPTTELSELAGLEKQLARRIQIHRFNRKSVDINLFNNIANGIVLSGFLEVKP